MIEQSDIERLREIFVTRKECDEKTESTEQQMHRMETKLAVIEENTNQQKWLVKTILGGVIGLIVTAVWSLLAKGGI